MLTAKAPERISVPATETFSPITERMAAETRATPAVNGTMTASLTGREATMT